ncbi:thioesterase family protein [Nocardioides aequoreus]|uniref:thioesterase family protein n=1 Tax=Nocardioides aequoreus TaxID=397278 RepID=UPI0004C44DC0|nr:thioesterase family protein [Nocardioides aequoreus]
MAYFERLDETTFRATEHTSGAWELEHQHVAPALGLLTHLVERDRDARRDDGLVPTRLAFDILGVMPVDELVGTVRVVRPGRTVELVEATLQHAGRDAVVLRAWLMQPGETAGVAGTDLPAMPGPDDTPPWAAADFWQGGLIATTEVRRTSHGPGRGHVWVRAQEPLLADEPVGPLAATAGLLDVANGMSVRVDPREVRFPNVDLAAHLFRQPAGDWVGFDTTVSLGTHGVGLTSSVLHDVHGPLGTLAQSLTVRPVA